MASFLGFPPGKVHLTPIPATFFSELLPQIDDIGELKITLFAFWFLDKQEGTVRYITQQDFENDQLLIKGLEKANCSLTESIQRVVQRGTMIKVSRTTVDKNDYFFLNTPRGRAAAEALRNGDWQPDPDHHLPASLAVQQPNVYRLYEENIGPLTAMIAEDLQGAENEYPLDWIEEAIHLAVQSNVRRWRYIEAILRSWKNEGHHT